MNKYKVVYFSEYRGPFDIEIEAFSVRVSKDHIVFFDEHGEDEYVFKREDVVIYYTI